MGDDEDGDGDGGDGAEVSPFYIQKLPIHRPSGRYVNCIIGLPLVTSTVATAIATATASATATQKLLLLSFSY